MNVSKKNPLYRLACIWDAPVPRNLCPFVRQAVYGLVKGVGLLAVTFCLALAATVIVVVNGVVNGVPWAWHRAVAYLRKYKADNYVEPVPRDPTVIVAYLKAVHDKVCPPITFKEK